MKQLLVTALIFSFSAVFADHHSCDNNGWCRVVISRDERPNDSRALLWHKRTKIVSVGVQHQPLAPPVYSIRLRDDLCRVCENKEDRIVYVSTEISGSETSQVVLDAMLIWEMLDSAKLAMAMSKSVSITVRTDLPGKRNIYGKYRDPIVRLTVWHHD